MFRPQDDPAALPRTGYTETAPAAPEARPLAGDMRADVCIIGAGFTGLSAALHAAAAGAKAVVLEANAIGWGSSGRNFGQVVPYLKHEPWTVLDHLGADRGERLIRAAADGADLVFALIERHGMGCEAARNGLIFAAHTPANLEKLRRRAAFWQARGVELPVLDAQAAARAIGGGSYWGALIERARRHHQLAGLRERPGGRGRRGLASGCPCRQPRRRATRARRRRVAGADRRAGWFMPATS